jgi:DNA-directed RNA polymerase subunit RPC12/RpoP
MGRQTLHASNQEDLDFILSNYKQFSSRIRDLNVFYRCVKCGKPSEKELEQLQRRPKLLCRGCWIEETTGVRNVSMLQEVKIKKALTRKKVRAEDEL